MANILAKRLNFCYIETGSMYRAVAWKAMGMNIDLNDMDAVARVAEDIDMTFSPQPDGQKVMIDNVDRTSSLKTETIGRGAAIVAANPRVREVMTAKQREMGKDGNAVMDGRDIGTVVFPNAETKIFLVADAEERAKRRFKEMKPETPGLDLDKVIEQVKQRDHDDENRKISPLKPAEDAVKLDTTHMQIEEVVEKIMQLIQSAETQ